MLDLFGLLHAQAQDKHTSGTNLLWQFHILPHWDRSYRPNSVLHPVQVDWHQASQSLHWPHHSSCLEGLPLQYQFLFHWYGGWNSSLVVCWAHCPAWCSVVGLILLWGEFFRRGDFSLEWTWVLTPFPKNSSDESINRGLVCAHIHSIAWTQEILTFMS